MYEKGIKRVKKLSIVSGAARHSKPLAAVSCRELSLKRSSEALSLIDLGANGQDLDLWTVSKDAQH